MISFSCTFHATSLRPHLCYYILHDLALHSPMAFVAVWSEGVARPEVEDESQSYDVREYVHDHLYPICFVRL